MTRSRPLRTYGNPSESRIFSDRRIEFGHAFMNYRQYAIDEGPLKVEHIKLIHGANYYSSGPVVMIRLDLGAYDEVFTDQIPGFLERLQALLPSLVEHRCSIGTRGGFFRRVSDGTLLGHVTEHVAIELEHLAGMDSGYGKTRSTQTPRVYHVVFGLIDDAVGQLTARGAVNAVNALLTGRTFDVAAFVDALVALREERLLGPSTQAIVDEAQRRDIPWFRLDRYNLVQLGTGRFQQHVRATITSNTNLIAVETADDKALTSLRLQEAGIPVPPFIVAADLDDALAFLLKVGGPVVVKPAVGHSGLGITLGVDQPDAMADALAWAQQIDDRVLVQAQVLGTAFRLLVIDGHMVAAVARMPAVIVGDGRHTIAELIDIANQAPERGVGDKTPLTRIDLDPVGHRLLAQQGWQTDAILPLGCRAALHISPALKFGGSSLDVTDQVHEVNRFLAERAARAIGLDVAGVDVIAPDISQSAIRYAGFVLGVSAAPDFRPHLSPTQGKRHDVATPLIDMLFPKGQQTRIPIFSITGTFGKTTAAHLLFHALKQKGCRVGLASSQGLFLEQRRITHEAATDPASVDTLLRDPDLDTAIFETPLEHILAHGLSYPSADFGVVLNVCDNHPETDELDDVQDIAYVKSVVAEQVTDGGYAILNADDPLVMEMRGRARGKIALCSKSYDHAEVRDHVDGGGLAVVLDRNIPVILDGRRRAELTRLDDLPITHHGLTNLNHDSLLASIAALYAFGFSVDRLDESLRTFTPLPPHTVGSLSLWETPRGSLLLDGAQHIVSLNAMASLLDRLARPRTAVIGLGPETRFQDASSWAAFLAPRFDRLMLTDERAPGSATQGFAKPLRDALIEHQVPAEALLHFERPQEAWQALWTHATPNSSSVIFTSRTLPAYDFIRAHLPAPTPTAKP